MQEIQRALFECKCINIRIDLSQNLPITILGKNTGVSKKKRRVSFNDIVMPDDIPMVGELINEISEGSSDNLSTHCRLSVGENEYHWFYISCRLAKDAFAKMPYLTGIAFDVSEYLESNDDDPVIAEFREKSAKRLGGTATGTPGLLEILDKDYLCKIQMAFRLTSGVYSAIFDENENFICTPNEKDNSFDRSKYRFTKSADIRINHKKAGTWVIGAQKSELVEKSEPLLDTLAKTVSKIANAFVVLFNEMENSQNANKMLGENVEQQILLNSIYAIILENKNSGEALNAVIKLVGEYYKLDRIAVYEDRASVREIKYSYGWNKSDEPRGDTPVWKYDDFPKLRDEIGYCDTFFSRGDDHELIKLGIQSFCISRLSENGAHIGLILYETLENDRHWSKSEKKVLRSVSQIISTMMIRYKTDKKLEKTNEQLRHLAFYDSVLNIPNRTKLDKDLLTELMISRSGAAVAVKVTNMRIINDIFGHGYTDCLLKAVADYIAQTPIDGLQVYRFTGNILIVTISECTAERAKQFAEALLFRFKKPWCHNGNEHYLEAGIGISLYPLNGSTCEEIYRASTLSMYRAIEYGKNSYAFYAREFENPSAASYKLEQKLRSSIADNMKGFYVNYQPVVYSGTGELKFCEAFVHWHDEETGELPPQRLVQLAENMGFDIPIDTWVIEKACRFCKEMQKSVDPNFSISVNITARELQTDAIGRIIASALEKSELEAKYLVIEIPERSLLDLFGDSSSALGRVKRLGVTIAIDSFGKNYMALNSLKNSCIDMVKVDQSLFTGTNDDFDRTLANSIITLSHSVGIKVCVKKIELREELEIVKRYGVDLIQGHYYSTPVSGEEMRLIVGNTSAQEILKC